MSHSVGSAASPVACPLLDKALFHPLLGSFIYCFIRQGTRVPTSCKALVAQLHSGARITESLQASIVDTRICQPAAGWECRGCIWADVARLIVQLLCLTQAIHACRCMASAPQHPHRRQKGPPENKREPLDETGCAWCCFTDSWGRSPRACVKPASIIPRTCGLSLFLCLAAWAALNRQSEALGAHLGNPSFCRQGWEEGSPGAEALGQARPAGAQGVGGRSTPLAAAAVVQIHGRSAGCSPLCTLARQC